MAVRPSDEATRNSRIQEHLEEIKEHVASDVLPAWQSERPGLTSDEFMHTSRITFAAKCFIIAHEYAHCYLGHQDTSTATTMETPDSSVVGEIGCLRQPQIQEILADLYAWEWLHKVGDKLPVKIDKTYVVLGVATFFHIPALAHHYDPSKYSDTTHPDALIRLRTILDAAIEPGDPPHSIEARKIADLYGFFSSTDE